MDGKFQGMVKILSRLAITASIIACTVKDVVLVVVFGPINIMYLCVLLAASIGLYSSLNSRALKITIAIPLSFLNFYAPVPNYAPMPWENSDIIKDRGFLFYLNGDYHYLIPIFCYYFILHVIIILCLENLNKTSPVNRHKKMF